MHKNPPPNKPVLSTALRAATDRPIVRRTEVTCMGNRVDPVVEQLGVVATVETDAYCIPIPMDCRCNQGDPSL